MKPAIEVNHLSKRFGTIQAIEDVSFSVSSGEIIGFLGPNGAGKSTTMRILCGLMPATSGTAYLCNISLATHSQEAKRHIGYLSENNPLPQDLRIVEYLRYRARLKEIPKKRQKERVEEVLTLCDLQHKVRRKIIGSLSKGYRQRVGIADAILAEPPILLMDEPTIGLDPHQILAIRELIANLRKRMTIVLSSHVLSEMERMCDRVIILNQGRIVAMGTHTALHQEFFEGETTPSLEDIFLAATKRSWQEQLPTSPPLS